MSSLADQARLIEAKLIRTDPEIHSIAVMYYPLTGKVFLSHLTDASPSRTVIAYANARNVKRVNAILRSVQPFIYKTVLAPSGMVQVFFRYPEEP